MDETKARRLPVDYRFDSLNWEFVKLMAQIAHYAGEKYGRPENYVNSRLEGEKDPLNHMLDHYRAYLAGEPHDHFGNPTYHLAAIAYNAMMACYNHVTWGHKVSELAPALKVAPHNGEQIGALMGELDAHAETQLTTEELDNASELIADPTNDLAGPEQGFLERFLTMVGGNRK